MQQITQPKLLTVDEAAQILRISGATLRSEERRGRFQFLRFRSVVRIDAREIHRYMKAAENRARTQRVATSEAK